MGLRLWGFWQGLGLRLWGFGFRALRFRVLDLGFRVLGLRVSHLGFRALELKVQDFEGSLRRFGQGFRAAVLVFDVPPFY